MDSLFNIAIDMLSFVFTFELGGNTYSFSILQVIIACMILGLFIYIFNRIYER